MKKKSISTLLAALLFLTAILSPCRMDTASAAAKIRVSKTSCKGRSNYDQGQKRRDKEDQSQGIRSKNCFGKGDQKENSDYREKAGKDKGYVDGISYEEMCGKRSGCTGRRGRG